MSVKEGETKLVKGKGLLSKISSGSGVQRTEAGLDAVVHICNYSTPEVEVHGYIEKAVWVTRNPPH